MKTSISRSTISRTLLSRGLLCAVIGTPCGFAAELEEIVVTARKKTENLQSVPVTVSAFTETALENRGIISNIDIAGFTPNVIFDNSSTFAGADTFQAFIRGVGQADFALNTDPGVGLYVDGVYYARAPGSVIDFLDVERVEILKGPQGTLFGRNSIGGAVSIVTRRPAEEFDFKAEVTIGQRDRQDVSGVVNLPLIPDKLYASVAFQANNRDGYQRRIPFGGNEGLGSASTSQPTAIPLDQLLVSDFSGGGGARDLGAKDSESFRAKLLWFAADAVEVTFAADKTAIRDAANPTTLIEVDPNSALGGLYNACINGAPIPPCGTSRFLPSGANRDGSRPDLLFNEQFITGDIDTSYSTGANFSNIDNGGVAATLDWEVSDNLFFKSITAYRELDSTFGLDLDGSPLVFDQTSFILDTEQFSQEFQFNGRFSDRFRYTAGLYYFDENGFQADRVPIAGGLIQVAGGFDHDTEAYAVFGEVNFDLTEGVTLNLGARFTEEEKTLLLNQQNLNTDFSTAGLDPADLPRPDAPEFLGPETPLSETFTNTSIRAGINWQINDSLFAYFSYSQGFKSGGFTTRLTNFFSDALIARADPNDPAVLRQLDFEEETADNFELGFKSQFLDNRARLNGAVFFNTYEDIQIVVQRGVSPSNENVAEAEIKGLELELELLPTDALTITATLGYLDAGYTEIDPAAAPLLFNRFGQQITTQTELANTPELTASLAVNLAIAKDWSLNANASFTGDVENDVFNTRKLSQEAYTVAGASLRYDSPNGKWNALLGISNLTDERYIVSGFEAGALPFTNASYNRPREWYFTVGYRY